MNEWLEELTPLAVEQAMQALHNGGRITVDDALALAEAALDAAEVDLARARHWLSIAQAVSGELGDPPALNAANAYANARLLVQGGDLPAATAALEDAQRWWHTAGDQAGVARSLLGQTQLLAMQGRYADAELAADSALQMLNVAEPEFSTQLRLAGAHHNLATLYVVQDRHLPALRAYANALAVLTALGERATTAEETEIVAGELAHNALNRASALTFLDRPQEAEVALNQAIADFDALGDLVNRGRARTNLGRLLLRSGRYAAALAAFEAASFDLLGSSAASVLDPAQLRLADELLLEQATAFLALNLLPEAAFALQRCEALFRAAGQEYELAQTCYIRGQVEMRQGDPGAAASSLAEALRLFSDLDNVFWRNRTLIALAMLDMQAGLADVAAARLDLLIDQPPAGEDGALLWDAPTQVDARLLRSNVAIAHGDFAAAEREIEAAASLSETPLASPAGAFPPMPQLAARVYLARGRLARRKQRFVDAQINLTAALQIIEQQRGEIPVEEIRTTFLDDKSEVYAELLLAILDAPDADAATATQAFDLVERARARSLLERLRATLGDPLQGSTAADDTSLAAAQLRVRLHWLYNRLLGEAGDRHVDLELTQALRAEEAALGELLQRSSPLLAQAQPAPLAEFQAALEIDAQAVAYTLAGDELMAFVISRRQIAVVRHLCSHDDLVAALREMHFQLGRASLGAEYVAQRSARLAPSLRSALGRLYDLLLRPLDRQITAANLLFLPTGSLHRLPFHLLWDGAQYLLERATCTVAPSASIAVHCARRPKDSGQKQSWAGLALNDPGIPAALSEVTQVARHFGAAELFLEERATLAGLHTAAAASILHVATHGLFRSDNPFFSLLKLADGWVDVRTLYRLPLQAALVVLSACESGVSEVTGGDEVVGLARGFLGAGAQSIVASLWNVHDASAVHLMDDFYAALTNDSMPPAAALRHAQLAALHSGQHPYFWASFFVIGA